MNERFAVDFVILPPDHIMDIAVSLNHQLCNGSNILLDKNFCYPHISLLMGCLRADQLEETRDRLNVLIEKHSSFQLKVSSIRNVKTDAGEIMTLDIERHLGLQALHEAMVSAFSPILSKDARPSDLFEDSNTNSSTLEWINNFIPNSCHKNFWPHITIGYLKTTGAPVIEPFTFGASRIAVCHLGNYCTCKKILIETTLPG